MVKDRRILLVDELKTLREGLRLMIEKQDDIEVIGEARDTGEAIKLARKLNPDIVIFGPSIPDVLGVQAIRRIITDVPLTKIIVLSTNISKSYVARVLKAGAIGFLGKDSSFKELVSAIKEINKNQIYVSPRIASMLIDDFLKRPVALDSGEYVILSQRELEILQVLAEGKSSKEIALLLGISQKTVDAHRRKIMEKLSFNSIAELIKYAIRKGLISLEE
ncbi:MAG: response regulator [Planctomycetota bacterium]